MMQIDSTTWRAARRALDRAIALYIEDPNVAFIDLGFATQQPLKTALAVRIHRRQKPSAAQNSIEAHDLGFAVEFVDSNLRFHLRQQASEVTPQICQELSGGIAIVNEAGRFFTLGGKVRDRQTGEAMVLSSWHVLSKSWAMGENVLIYQPVSANGDNTAEVIAEFARNAISCGLDAAVSRLKSEKLLFNEQRGIGAVTGVALPQLGMQVIKSGAGSGVTSGVITGILGYSLQRYANRKQLIGPLVCIAPESTDQKISAPGDSGAWWLERSTRRAVALHFAGSDHPNSALAFSMPEVLEALEVDIDVTIAPTVSLASSAQLSQADLPEKVEASAARPEAKPATASVIKAEAATVEAAAISSPLKDVILAADFEVISVIDQKDEEPLGTYLFNAIKLIPPKIAASTAALKRQVLYRLMQAMFVLVFAMTVIGFDRHATKAYHQQDEQIAQLHKELHYVKTIAQIDSARQQQIRRIVVIIDRFNPEMNSEVKFNLAAEIYAMSLKYHELDVDLICATITHESARTWNPEVVSFAGALGLMQIVPSTGIGLARQEGITWTSAEEILFNPIYNVRLGCRYLATLVTDYGLEAGLAAYNGGDRQAKRWLRGDSLLHPETAYYVPAVLKIYKEYRSMRL